MTENFFYSTGTLLYDHQSSRLERDQFYSLFRPHRSAIHLYESSKRKDDEPHPRNKHSRKPDSKPDKSQFDDARLFCDDCQQYHENLCLYHQHLYIPDTKVSKSTLQEIDRPADMTCPDGIFIQPSTVPGAGKGIFASKRFEKNTYFGPYTGARHTNFKLAQDSGYAWSIADKYGKMVYIVDGRDPTTSNWMRYVNCPNYIEQQNLIPVQYDRNMFYKTIRTIEPGEEFFVYYGDDYARYLGIEPFLSENIEIKTGPLSLPLEKNRS